MRAAVLGLAVASASLEYSEDTQWTTKQGFIPGTKADVATGFWTISEAQRQCAAKGECVAITFRGSADDTGAAHMYLKADSTVAESDKTWTSFIKRPAGDDPFRHRWQKWLRLFMHIPNIRGT